MKKDIDVTEEVIQLKEETEGQADRTSQLIREAIEEHSPQNGLDHALLFAELKTKEDITQNQYSELAGIAPRTLRKYIADNRHKFDQRIHAVSAQLERKRESGSLGTLTESQLDQFLQGLIDRAIKPDAKTRDVELLIRFADLKGADLLELKATKERSLRWQIKETLGSICQYLDSYELGIMLEECNLLARGDRFSEINQKRFMSSSLEDTDFKLELMYFGMLFISLYNEQQHPQLALLATAVRLNRIKKESNKQQLKDSSNLSKYAEGKDIKPPEPFQGTDEELKAELDRLMLKIFDGNRAEMEESSKRLANVERKVTAPVIDADKVWQEADAHEEDLKVIVTLEDFLKDLGIRE